MKTPLNVLQRNFSELQAKARNDHPIQSHMSADAKNRSKTLSADRLEVLDAIYVWPGRTAKILDTIYHLDGKAHRRSLELENLGLIFRDKTKREMTMWLTDKGREALK